MLKIHINLFLMIHLKWHWFDKLEYSTELDVDFGYKSSKPARATKFHILSRYKIDFCKIIGFWKFNFFRFIWNFWTIFEGHISRKYYLMKKQIF